MPKMTIVRHSEHTKRASVPEEPLPYIPEKSTRQKLQELQGMINQEQSVIQQTSNALNQCCGANSSFAGSTEAVECHRLLLIACEYTDTMGYYGLYICSYVTTILSTQVKCSCGQTVVSFVQLSQCINLEIPHSVFVLYLKELQILYLKEVHFGCSMTQCFDCFCLLLTGKKREGYLAEMLRLREDRPQASEGPRGSLTISDIRLPLKSDFTQKIGTPSGKWCDLWFHMVFGL